MPDLSRSLPECHTLGGGYNDSVLITRNGLETDGQKWEWVRLSSPGYFGTLSRACCRILRLLPDHCYQCIQSRLRTGDILISYLVVPIKRVC
jgi:hypothetical protein